MIKLKYLKAVRIETPVKTYRAPDQLGRDSRFARAGDRKGNGSRNREAIWVREISHFLLPANESSQKAGGRAGSARHDNGHDIVRCFGHKTRSG